MYKMIAEEISRDPGVCLLWGAPDTGKTTMTAFLASFCADRGLSVAVVDGDVGQSDVGPPGTIGLGFVAAVVPTLKAVGPSALYFVGSTSPRGHELRCAVGTHLMVQLALRSGADVVVVDTAGAVFGGGARLLREAELDLLRPRYLLALQRTAELEHLLRVPGPRGSSRIVRLPPLPKVRRRGGGERRRNRERSFARHLSGAVEHTISIAGIGISGTFFGSGRRAAGPETGLPAGLVGEVIHAEWVPEGLYVVVRDSCPQERIHALEESGGRVLVRRERDFANRLVGLLDGEGLARDVGILLGVHFQARKLHVLASAEAPSAAREIRFGRLRVTRAGRELPPGSCSAGL